MLRGLSDAALAASRLFRAAQLDLFLQRYFTPASGGLAPVGATRDLPPEGRRVFVPDLVLVPSPALAVETLSANVTAGLDAWTASGGKTRITFQPVANRRRASDRRNGCAVSMRFRTAAPPEAVSEIEQRLASRIAL